jgi:hypothetical protein
MLPSYVGMRKRRFAYPTMAFRGLLQTVPYFVFRPKADYRKSWLWRFQWTAADFTGLGAHFSAIRLVGIGID